MAFVDMKMKMGEDRNPEAGTQLQRDSKGAFTCQGHRQPHTKLHAFIATEPLAFAGAERKVACIKQLSNGF